MQELHRIGHKAYKNILITLSQNRALSTKAIAQEQNHLSTSRILKYLKYMKEQELVEEFFETICSIKHDCKFRSTHYLVNSGSIEKAYKTQSEWIKKNNLIEDGVDVQKYVIGRLLTSMICKKCKRTLSYDPFYDEEGKRFNTSESYVIKNRDKPIRYWSLTANGIYHIISKSRNAKFIKKLVRKYRDKNKILELASLLHSDDLKLLIERLRTATKFRLEVSTEANKWFYDVRLDLSKYNDASRDKIQNILNKNYMLISANKILVPERELISKNAHLEQNAISLINLGEETIVKLLNDKMLELNEAGFRPETEEVYSLQDLRRELPSSWRKDVLRKMGLAPL